MYCIDCMITVIFSCNSKEYRACWYCRVQITGYEILLFSTVYVAQLDFSKEYRAKYRLHSIDCRAAVVHYIITSQFFVIPLNNKNIHFIFQN